MMRAFRGFLGENDMMANRGTQMSRLSALEPLQLL